MVNKSNQKRKERKRGKRNGTREMSGVIVSLPPTLALTMQQPGRAFIRSTATVLSNSGHHDFGMHATNGFPSWAPKVAAVLGIFRYWRVLSIKVTYTVTGGAASPYYIIGNLSNDGIYGDAVVTAVLDDDYAGVANGVTPLVLEPPRAYWKLAPVTWYNTDASSEAATRNAGCVIYVGGGGALATTEVGWVTVDMEFEYHTLT